MGLEGAELSVLVVGDRKMRALNREYRGMDRTTDVLSFSMLEGEGGGGSLMGGEDMPLVLGDVVISAPMAASQAEALGHSLEREMIFLLVHGILHLAGYDHERSKADERKMLKKQRELMELLKAG
jgi:probable rRNA maturation factor